MKHKFTKQIMSMLLAFVMVIGLIPVSSLTAFATQFPEGVGSSASNPAMCYSYAEFKYAMESNDIRYVALANVDDTLPLVSMEDASPYGDNRYPGIWVNSSKNLILLGNAQFTAPIAEENVHRVYSHLIQIRQGGRLNISGAGSLTFHGNAVGWVTSVAEVVDGGVLTINSGTVKGDTGNRTSFCYGINMNGGTLYANGGTVIGTDRHSYGGGISAVMLYDGVAYIHGGNFYSNVSDGAAEHDHYGLSIGEDGTCYLYGGAFEGIKMPYASTMSDHVEDGYTMTVNGVKTNPASCGTTDKYVEVYKEISKVDIHVNSPVAGKAPTMYPEDVYLVPEGVTVKDPVWYENGQPWNLNSGAERFEAGSSYRVELTIIADNGYKFPLAMTSSTINGKWATYSPLAGNAEKGIVMTLDFGVCPALVTDVALTVTAPKEGDISYAPTDDQTGATVWETTWLVSNTGADGTFTEKDWYSTFQANKYYKVQILLKAINNYEFATYDDGVRIQPGVTVTVNSYQATVYKSQADGEEDPSEYIVVEYNFGKCDDSVIEEIVIKNVVAPVVGATPSYSLSVLGSCFNSEGEAGFHLNNGVEWSDVTNGGGVLYPETKFIAGHTYQVTIYLHANEGYEFATTSYGYPATTATVNGKAATVVQESNSSKWQTVIYQFTCTQQKVSTVMLYLDAPVAGKTPDYTASVAYPEWYRLDPNYAGSGGIVWFDSEGNQMDPADTFTAGEIYKVEIRLIPTQLGGANTSRFVSPVTAYVNGKEVIANGDWDLVNAKSDYVSIYYTFKNCAAVPEIVPYVFITQPKGGTLNVGESHNTYWETSFIPTQTEIQYWDGEAWDQWDIQNPENTLDDYDFDSAKEASYRFRIEAYIGNEIVATSNEFTVTWQVAPTISTGDVNLDGKINGKDVLSLRKYIVGLDKNINLDNADCNFDGKINGKDVLCLRKYIVGLINEF